MRPDQYTKLQSLSEKLADVFIQEANPDNWPGAGLLPADMDKQTRGDRYWVKKNAVATLSLLTKMDTLKGVAAPAADSAETEGLLDEEIASAEKEAAKLLDTMTRRDKKVIFDKRVHGKA